MTAPLPHISPTTAKKLAKLNIHNAWDALLHLPLRYEDETRLTPIADTQIGQSWQIQGQITHQEITFRPRRQLIAQIRDASGGLNLRLLHFYPSQQKQLAIGNTVRAIGEVRLGHFGKEMVHPKIHPISEHGLPQSLTPVYPSTAGLQQSQLRRLISQLLEQQPPSEILPANLPHIPPLPSLADSLRLLHNPPPDISPQQLDDPQLPARQRLKFDELLAQQLSMRTARAARQQQRTQAIIGTGKLNNILIQNLPFALTEAQQRVITEIRHDLARPTPMNRLLQGDVGSGKTIVAALAALTAIEAGQQVALMAPTEILAEQHHHKLRQWFEPLGIRLVSLSGHLKKKDKTQAQHDLAQGHAQIAIGTHALFQQSVEFQNLGLSIIDEQHRFGVAQRLALRHKGQAVHQLMMSATPIPRTLAMSFFADLDISTIDSLPPNRTPIQTRLINQTRQHEVEGFVLAACQKGRQAYWVCPLVEESEQLQLQAACDKHQELVQALPQLNIGLVHGRLKAAEKAAVMADFIAGKIHVLVATTVIEVGVDVPNATVIVIEHASRMGLAQLHQLRGRVGRGGHTGHCLLLYSEPLSPTARERLKTIYQHTDGFEIARHDLRLRGPGELLGARQSGLPMLRFADPEADIILLEAARQTAHHLLTHHPKLAQAHIDRWLPQSETYLGA